MDGGKEEQTRLSERANGANKPESQEHWCEYKFRPLNLCERGTMFSMSSNDDERDMVDVQHGLHHADRQAKYTAVITKQPPSDQPMRYRSETKNCNCPRSQKGFTTAPLLPQDDAWIEIELQRGNEPIPGSIEVTMYTCNIAAHERTGPGQYLPHPFPLIGTGTLDGVYQREHCGNQPIRIPRLKIEKCSGKKVENNLRDKIVYDSSGQLNQILETSDKSQLKTSMNAVRLCILLKLMFSDKSFLVLDPLYSYPIMDSSKIPKERTDEYGIMARRARKKLKCGTGNQTFSVNTHTDAIYARGVTDGGTEWLSVSLASGSKFNSLSGSKSSSTTLPVNKAQVNSDSGHNRSSSQPGKMREHTIDKLRSKLIAKDLATSDCAALWHPLEKVVGYTPNSSAGNSHFKDIQGSSGSGDKEQGMKQSFTFFSGNDSDTEQICKRSDVPLDVGKNLKSADRGPENVHLSTSSARSQHVTRLGDLGENNHIEMSIVDESNGGGHIPEYLKDFILEYDSKNTNTDIDNISEGSNKCQDLRYEDLHVNPPFYDTQHAFTLEVRATVGQVNQEATGQADTSAHGTDLSAECMELFSDLSQVNPVQEVPIAVGNRSTYHDPLFDSVEHDTYLPDDLFN